eukprot:6292024-Prymnesium_polylepis.1
MDRTPLRAAWGIEGKAIPPRRAREALCTMRHPTAAEHDQSWADRTAKHSRHSWAGDGRARADPGREAPSAAGKRPRGTVLTASILLEAPPPSSCRPHGTCPRGSSSRPALAEGALHDGVARRVEADIERVEARHAALPEGVGHRRHRG